MLFTSCAVIKSCLSSVQILNKYMGRDEKVESWQKAAPPPKARKVVKTMVRTKSGRMVSSS